MFTTVTLLEVGPVKLAQSCLPAMINASGLFMILYVWDIYLRWINARLGIAMYHGYMCQVQRSLSIEIDCRTS